MKYQPECYRLPNKQKYKYGVIEYDRSGNCFQLIVCVFLDKKGATKEQILQVVHLDKLLQHS